MQFLRKDDPVIADLAVKEEIRIENTINLIAAESHSRRSIMETLGSIFNTKTIEGYPGKRFHAGCIHVDAVENLAIERAKALFGAEAVNVQPHSGTSANLAVYFSVLNVGDKILSMSLPHGGHLSHGHRASITSKCFDFRHYSVDRETERIDYNRIREQALDFRPRMIVAGASSYPRLIDYQAIAEIAQEVSAYFLVDMAHLGGLVAGKAIPSPVPHADFVTFTCYKTMMGGRGGMILSRKAYERGINRAVFPGCQGTSAVNLIAAKAVICKIADTDEFRQLQLTTLELAEALAARLQELGYRIVTGGTDNHQVLVDFTGKGITGAAAEKTLESVGIVLNRNVVPTDADTPGAVSGLRLGTAAIAGRGMGTAEVDRIAELMDEALRNADDEAVLNRIRLKVRELCAQFPVYGGPDMADAAA